MSQGMLDLVESDLERLFAERRARIAVVGFGYIGAVIGAVFADRGWDVIGLDVRAEVVDEINAGKTRVREPGLDEVVAARSPRVTSAPPPTSRRLRTSTW